LKSLKNYFLKKQKKINNSIGLLTLLLIFSFSNKSFGDQRLLIEVNENCLVNKEVSKAPPSAWLGGTIYEFFSSDFSKNYTITLLVPSENEIAANLPKEMHSAFSELLSRYANTLLSSFEIEKVKFLKKPSLRHHEMIFMVDSNNSIILYGFAVAEMHGNFVLLRVSEVYEKIADSSYLKNQIIQTLNLIKKSCLS
jgi:hypothetical protein